MASPQKEDGFVPIANEIVEHLVSVKMSGTEWQYVMCLFRKTYGWNKTEDWVTNSQIVAMTGLKKERVSEAKSRLVARNIVTEKRNKISFQKDWEQWIELRKSVPIVTEKRISLLRKSVHTKDTNTKDKIGELKNSHLKGKNMGFNNKNYNDDNLPSIGDDGQIEKPTPKVKRNYKPVYFLFEEILGKKPNNWMVNVTQQKCAENLFIERGVPAIKNALQWYKENKEKEYCPQITSPSDLDGKWTKLATFKQKYGN